jgi:hypothetical protein
MSRHAGSIVRGFQSRAGYPHLTGRQQVAGIYCQPDERSRYRGLAEPRLGLREWPNPTQMPLVNWLSRLQLKSEWNRDRVFKNCPPSCAFPRSNQGIVMALSQDQTGQDNPAGDIAWTVLDAANDLGDTVTVDACRRVIDASLQGIAPAPADMALVVAFFG